MLGLERPVWPTPISWERRRKVRKGALLLALAASLAIGGLHAQSHSEGLVKKTLPYLEEKIRSLGPDIYPAFLAYAERVLDPQWVKTDEDIGSLLEQRGSLVKEILRSEPVIGFLSDQVDLWQFKNRSGDWERYDRELRSIGIQTYFAEGLLAGFAEGPLLDELVTRVASEPYRLYLRMREAFADSYGGEYPYLYDLKAEMETIELGEQFLARYPGSKYEDRAKEVLGQALFPLTDWHIAVSDDPAWAEKRGENPPAYVGELHTRLYPWHTDVKHHQEFLETYPQSRFYEVIARIVREPSEISPGKTVSVVVVDDFADKAGAQKAIVEYLLKGLDIPHLVTVDETHYLVAYRFFSDPDKANKALLSIRKTKPGAKIVGLSPRDDRP